MSKKHFGLKEKIKKIAKPILHWWNLKNWTSASDLFFKLFSIVALILAADFFLLKPTIEWEVKYLDKIDRNKVEEIYSNEGKDIPFFLEDAINNYLYSLDYHGQTA